MNSPIITCGVNLVMAVIPIFMGSLASISTMKLPMNARKKKNSSNNPLKDDNQIVAAQKLSSSEALLLPMLGSILLYGLHNMNNSNYSELLIKIYISVTGCVAITRTMLMIAGEWLPSSVLKHVAKYQLTFSKRSTNISHVYFTVIHEILLLGSIVLTVYFGYTNNWIASNVMSISIAVNVIQLVSLDSFKTGIILLVGRLVCGMAWEAYMPATKIETPIQLVWPNHHAMIELGDIVVPGIFIALCLCFDRSMSWKRNPSGSFRSTQFPKPYFYSTLVGYIASVCVMDQFGVMGMYLSPWCVVLVIAGIRGEIKNVFEYLIE